MAAMSVLVSASSLAANDDFEQAVLPVLRQYCNHCHSTSDQAGELDLEQFVTPAIAMQQPEVWQRVLEQLDYSQMPPKDEVQLPEALQTEFTASLQKVLHRVALAQAGDPGKIVLRRLSNMEHNYTIRDLTGVASLDPTREFPIDGAAGEGFTNVGGALVMSPALLTKYLDAAKAIAQHAVLLPDGIRFSSSTTARDWTDETRAKIVALYERYTVTTPIVNEVAGTQGVNSSGGNLPLDNYLDAVQGRTQHSGLSSKYLRQLQTALTSEQPSVLLAPLRTKFQTLELTADDIEPWQRRLGRFSNVGHIGKVNGPQGWLEPVSPLSSRTELQLPLVGDSDVTVVLATSDAGDGSDHDHVIWENPRLVTAGRADIPAAHLPALIEHLTAQRQQIIDGAPGYLRAIERSMAGELGESSRVAEQNDAGLDVEILDAWRETMGLSNSQLAPLLTDALQRTPEYDFIQGWTGEQALGVLANSSDTSVRIPGRMPPHSVATHPSPSRAAVIAWKSPIAGELNIDGDVTHVHPECGNGITWALELRQGSGRETLASGLNDGANTLKFAPSERVFVRVGDVLALVIGPRDGEHSCDLTSINLRINDGTSQWNLAQDVSPNILAGNPHGVWHFLSQPTALETASQLAPALALWRKEPTAENASQVQQHLRQDLPLNSPLLAPALRAFLQQNSALGTENSLTAEAPSVIEIDIPAELVRGTEFRVTGRLASLSAGSVQMQLLMTKPQPSFSTDNKTTQDNSLNPNLPIIVNDGSETRQVFEAAFEEFRALFPRALCYTTIVPIDEVVTARLFYREDEHLQRLMLDDAEIVELDRLWSELLFVSEAPLKQVDAIEQLVQFATQDGVPSDFAPMQMQMQQAAQLFRQQQLEVEPVHVQAVVEFADRAWRRPLSEAEKNSLSGLYATLRNQGLPHADTIRLLLARVFVAPAYLYRSEQAIHGEHVAAVSDNELATRLSYFLWSSLPDEPLRHVADADQLYEAEQLLAQTRRMLQSEKVRRLATEFGCQWLHVRDLETLDEKSERHFPEFIPLRAAMQEEVVQFFIDLFRENRSLLSLLDADHSFLNAPLAEYYGVELPSAGLANSESSNSVWQRVAGMHSRGRGGILGFAATLAKQSGASRTSPILRGNWISEVILGERLPRPPKDTPVLPDETPAGLTERQFTERHSSDPACARCHDRIDHFGFALEGFDAIGRARTQDATGLTIDTIAHFPDGSELNGLGGLRTYLLDQRREDFLRQFCRKLLGYALGRSVQLSDEPLLDEMLEQLQANDYKVGSAIESIVLSPQFREIRGTESPLASVP